MKWTCNYLTCTIQLQGFEGNLCDLCDDRYCDDHWHGAHPNKSHTYICDDCYRRL